MTQVQVHQPGRCTGLWPASRRESKSTQQNRNRWECVCTATNSFSRRGVYLSSLTGILSLPAPCACSWQGPASKQNCPGPRGLPQPLIRQSTHLQSEEPTCLYGDISIRAAQILHTVQTAFSQNDFWEAHFSSLVNFLWNSKCPLISFSICQVGLQSLFQMFFMRIK